MGGRRRRPGQVGEDSRKIGNDPQEAFGLNGEDQRNKYGGEQVLLGAGPLWESGIYV